MYSTSHVDFNVLMRLALFIATLRIAGALEKSTEVMKSMQALIKIPEIQATMRDMSKEMMKVETQAVMCSSISPINLCLVVLRINGYTHVLTFNINAVPRLEI